MGVNRVIKGFLFIRKAGFCCFGILCQMAQTLALANTFCLATGLAFANQPVPSPKHARFTDQRLSRLQQCLCGVAFCLVYHRHPLQRTCQAGRTRNQIGKRGAHRRGLRRLCLCQIAAPIALFSLIKRQCQIGA